MYVDLLQSAMDQLIEPGANEHLARDVFARRRELFMSNGAGAYDVYAVLAREVAYDLALISLCRSKSIEVKVEDFSHPHSERCRLERALSHIGVDVRSFR
ncbi:MAG: hypothetical protein ACYCPT_07360 [Acidimicrobiales bacterium]